MTIKIFSGDDRARALQAATRFLGSPDYEVIEGSELETGDLPNIFHGTTLLTTGERKILLRDALESPAGREIAKYVGTPHRVAILELKPDKRGEGWKNLVAAGVDSVECKAATPDTQVMFDIYRVAKRDGAAAVRMLEGIRGGLEPKAFVGVLAAGAMRDYSAASEGPGARSRSSALNSARRILKDLAQLDLDLGAPTATASPERPWLLIEGFLMRMGTTPHQP